MGFNPRYRRQVVQLWTAIHILCSHSPLRPGEGPGVRAAAPCADFKIRKEGRALGFSTGDHPPMPHVGPAPPSAVDAWRLSQSLSYTPYFRPVGGHEFCPAWTFFRKFFGERFALASRTSLSRSGASLRTHAAGDQNEPEKCNLEKTSGFLLQSGNVMVEVVPGQAPVRPVWIAGRSSCTKESRSDNLRARGPADRLRSACARVLLIAQ